MMLHVKACCFPILLCSIFEKGIQSKNPKIREKKRMITINSYDSFVVKWYKTIFRTFKIYAKHHNHIRKRQSQKCIHFIHFIKFHSFSTCEIEIKEVIKKIWGRTQWALSIIFIMCQNASQFRSYIRKNQIKKVCGSVYLLFAFIIFLRAI